MGTILNLLAGVTAVGILLLVFKRLFSKLLPAKVQYYLWLVLAVRMVVPILPASPVSMMRLLPTVQEAHGTGSIQPTGAEDAYVITSPMAFAGETREFSVPQNTGQIIWIIWLAGAGLAYSGFLCAYVIYSRRVQKFSVCDNPQVLHLLENCKKCVGIPSKKKVPIRIGGDTPLIKGVWKPVILIPEGTDMADLELILIHELCHMCHWDNLIAFIETAFVCLYWFHPLIWYCHRVFKRDTEILCDDAVVIITNSRKPYAELLYHTALVNQRNHFFISPLQSDIRRRIGFLANQKKTTILGAGFIFISILLICAVCLTGNKNPESRLTRLDWAYDHVKAVIELSLYKAGPDSKPEEPVLPDDIISFFLGDYLALTGEEILPLMGYDIGQYDVNRDNRLDYLVRAYPNMGGMMILPDIYAFLSDPNGDYTPVRLGLNQDSRVILLDSKTNGMPDLLFGYEGNKLAYNGQGEYQLSPDNQKGKEPLINGFAFSLPEINGMDIQVPILVKKEIPENCYIAAYFKSSERYLESPYGWYCDSDGKPIPYTSGDFQITISLKRNPDIVLEDGVYLFPDEIKYIPADQIS